MSDVRKGKERNDVTEVVAREDVSKMQHGIEMSQDEKPARPDSGKDPEGEVTRKIDQATDEKPPNTDSKPSESDDKLWNVDNKSLNADNNPSDVEDKSSNADDNSTESNSKLSDADEKPSDSDDTPSDSDEPYGLIMPSGEINWDCPCLQGMADGPCGEQFKTAFSCFHYSESDPKGSDCIDQFRTMQECFESHPEFYIAKDDDDETADNDIDEGQSEATTLNEKSDNGADEISQEDNDLNKKPAENINEPETSSMPKISSSS